MSCHKGTAGWSGTEGGQRWQHAVWLQCLSARDLSPRAASLFEDYNLHNSQ